MGPISFDEEDEGKEDEAKELGFGESRMMAVLIIFCCWTTKKTAIRTRRRKKKWRQKGHCKTRAQTPKTDFRKMFLNHGIP